MGNSITNSDRTQSGTDREEKIQQLRECSWTRRKWGTGAGEGNQRIVVAGFGNRRRQSKALGGLAPVSEALGVDHDRSVSAWRRQAVGARSCNCWAATFSRCDQGRHTPRHGFVFIDTIRDCSSRLHSTATGNLYRRASSP